MRLLLLMCGLALGSGCMERPFEGSWEAEYQGVRGAWAIQLAADGQVRIHRAYEDPHPLSGTSHLGANVYGERLVIVTVNEYFPMNAAWGRPVANKGSKLLVWDAPGSEREPRWRPLGTLDDGYDLVMGPIWSPNQNRVIVGGVKILQRNGQWSVKWYLFERDGPQGTWVLRDVVNLPQIHYPESPWQTAWVDDTRIVALVAQDSGPHGTSQSWLDWRLESQEAHLSPTNSALAALSVSQRNGDAVLYAIDRQGRLTMHSLDGTFSELKSFQVPQTVGKPLALAVPTDTSLAMVIHHPHGVVDWALDGEAIVTVVEFEQAKVLSSQSLPQYASEVFKKPFTLRDITN